MRLSVRRNDTLSSMRVCVAKLISMLLQCKHTCLVRARMVLRLLATMLPGLLIVALSIYMLAMANMHPMDIMGVCLALSVALYIIGLVLMRSVLFTTLSLGLLVAGTSYAIADVSRKRDNTYYPASVYEQIYVSLAFIAAFAISLLTNIYYKRRAAALLHSPMVLQGSAAAPASDIEVSPLLRHRNVGYRFTGEEMM
jgi:hypothetical protein